MRFPEKDRWKLRTKCMADKVFQEKANQEIQTELWQTSKIKQRSNFKLEKRRDTTTGNTGRKILHNLDT